MRIIASHTNLDFDGFASMIAAKKLYPQAEIVLASKLSPEVDHFLAIYKDTYSFKRVKNINMNHVRNITLVDTNSLSRTGDLKNELHEEITFTVYDHHPLTEKSVTFEEGVTEQVGATVTLLIEEIQRKEINIKPFEATIFALGIYSDTGAFTYSSTTGRDLQAAAWLLDNGASLAVVEKYREAPLEHDQQSLFETLLDQSTQISIDGVNILVATHEQEKYTGNLAYISRRIMDRSGVDAVFSIVKMGEKVFITSRSSSERINVLPIIKQFSGGGHKKAASAMIKHENVNNIQENVLEQLNEIVTPSLTAEHIMTSPVRVVAPDTTIEVASKMLYRYGHTGFPVIKNDQLIGVISRRDVDKALHHNLGHAPVKGYMSTTPVIITIDTSLEEIREKMIYEHVGRLPVMKDGTLIGIVSRSDVICAMHEKPELHITYSKSSSIPYRKQLIQEMRKQFSPPVYDLLMLIGQEAAHKNMKAYLIGGMVRDLLLERQNEDMDIVIEGDGIELAEKLQSLYGGHVRPHEEFRTATWTHPTGFKIDLTSARTEYYDFPAALPKVEMSNIKEDLYRRDFTINAMGICLHEDQFGELIDYFQGYEDLKQGKLKVLYNLSFVEDPTRILRAIRFESRFQFFMNDQTFSLAKQSANHILSVSKQRLSSELNRLFFEEDSLYGYHRLDELNILPYLLEHIVDESSIYKRLEAFKEMRNKIKNKKIKLSRSLWAGQFFSLTSLSIHALEEIEAFCLTKDDGQVVQKLYSLLEEKPLDNISIDSPYSEWHKHFANVKIEPLVAYFAIEVSMKPEFMSKSVEYIVKRETLEPLLDGKDLIEHGLSPGPHFKEMLEHAERLQMDNSSLSKQSLLEDVLRYQLDTE
ncbi:CBS domain-containing protein [Bacillus shivajii]|uniref:CBS domain-containing protein n=1 Tax=Bacillus shivajii TaxID=1983719 RepID=UPI001CFB2AEA|nr:CBS domain-containing protein [Bacillus shivajii]UCZ54437.1 CBS domain-containing protein [Bacillus shivajii]